MKNLTPNQIEIIKTIEAEFSKINEVETGTDILSLIDKAINEKHNLRKELEIIDKNNRESIIIIKNQVMETLQTICDKYNFSLKCRVENDHYHIRLSYNGYHNKYNSVLSTDAIIALPILDKDSIRYVGYATPIFKHYADTYRFENKEQFIKYFVDETIKVLKSNI